MPPVFSYQTIAYVTRRRIDNVALKRWALFTVEYFRRSRSPFIAPKLWRSFGRCWGPYRQPSFHPYPNTLCHQ